METEISEKSSEKKYPDSDGNVALFQFDNASSLNELLPGVSDQDKWITMLGENGLILTRSDSSSDEQVQSSTSESVQNLLQNTTTSVISVGEGENAESYIVIKAKQDLSAPGSILATNYQSEEQTQRVIKLNIDSMPGSIFSDNFNAQNKLQKELSNPVLERSVTVEEIHISEFIQQSRQNSQVGMETRINSTNKNDKDNMKYNMADNNEIKTHQFAKLSNIKSIENNFPKEKVENAIEELSEFINRGQGMNSRSDQESENKLAEAHRYLTEYVQQIQESGMGQNKEADDSKEDNEYESDEDDSNGDKKENNADEKLLVRKLKARTLSESEKVAAVEGLIQMSLSTENRQPDARKRLNDALKAGIKNLQRDVETFDAVEGLIEIGNTPMQQLEQSPKKVEIEKSSESEEVGKSKSTSKTLKELLSKNDPAGMLMIKSLPYKIYRCVNCEQTFVNEDEVRAISRSADFRRLYMCHECHLSKQDGFLHKCRLCGAGFQAIRGLEQHFENHELKYIYRCDYCGKGFGYHGRNRYLSHERTHKGPNPCFCSICGMQFSRPVYLHMHTEKTHKRKKMHFCEICGQFFTSLDLLRTHYRAQHFCYDTTSSQVSDYRCGICNEVYPSLYMLNTHLVIHTRLSQGFEDMYECLVCNKRFKNVRNLQKHHIRLHPDQHLYNCHICNKEFQSPSVRDNHLYKAHDIKLDGVEDLDEDKSKVKTELVPREEMVYKSDDGQTQVISEEFNLMQEKSTLKEPNETHKSIKEGNSGNLKTLTYKSDKIGDSSSTEVVFGGTDAEESEPTILVEMKNPRLDTTLNRNSRKMMSLLTPQSLAKLQKAKVELGNQSTEGKDTGINSDSTKSQSPAIVGSEIQRKARLDSSKQENSKSNMSFEQFNGDDRGTVISENGDKSNNGLSNSAHVKIAEQSNLSVNSEDEQSNKQIVSEIKTNVSGERNNLGKVPEDANVERQETGKLVLPQQEEETKMINDGINLGEAKDLKCAGVKEAGESEITKQKTILEQNKVMTGKDKKVDSLNKGDNSQKERKRKTNGKSSETESKQKKLNENFDKSNTKQLVDVKKINKNAEKIKPESDSKMEEVAGTRKSSRKIRHTWKYLESVDSENEKSSNSITDNKDTSKVTTPETFNSNRDTELYVDEIAESFSVSEKRGKISNSKFPQKDGEQTFHPEASETTGLSNSKNKNAKSTKDRNDQTCSVVLEDIGACLSKSEIVAQSGRDQGKLSVDEEMSAASANSSSWSEKFQEFVNQSSSTGKELKRKKMASDTDTKESDGGMKKVSKM